MYVCPASTVSCEQLGACLASQGLEYADLIVLKRAVHRQKASANASTQPAAAAVNVNTKTEAFISRRSSGMSFDFSKADGRMYMAGTEDGHIHKCSTSYAEQYLATYSGHMGPVYQLQWSPFKADLFVSSSADWTVKLWSESKVGQCTMLVQLMCCPCG